MDEELKKKILHEISGVTRHTTDGKEQRRRENEFLTKEVQEIRRMLEKN